MITNVANIRFNPVKLPLTTRRTCESSLLWDFNLRCKPHSQSVNRSSCSMALLSIITLPSSGPLSVDDETMHDGPIKTNYWSVICPVVPSSFSETPCEVLNGVNFRAKRMKPEDGMWDCSVCTYKNSAEAFKCAMCDVRKGTSTR